MKVCNHFKTEQLNPIRSEWEQAEQFLINHLCSLRLKPLPPNQSWFPPSQHHLPGWFWEQKLWEGGFPHPSFLSSLQSLWPRWVVTASTTLMRCDGMGRAGCMQLVGCSAVICMYCLPGYPYLHCLYHTARGIDRPAVSASDQSPAPLQLMLQAPTFSHSLLFFFFNAWSIYFKSTHSYMVGEIKQQHRKRSPLGKYDYTLLGGFSCWESACIFPHCIWRSLIVLCCFLQQNWEEYDEISQSPESSFVQQIQPWPFLMFSFPSFPHFCRLVFSWMLPLKPPYQYSEMISEVWIKSIKSSRDQIARHICRV